jgi:hypothetical protein
VLEHDAVVCGVEGYFEVCVHDVHVLVVDFGVLHYDDDGGEFVVDAAEGAKAILLIFEDAVGFCVLKVCVFNQSCP